MHLTGNLGITDQVIKYLHKRTKCREPLVEEPVEDFSVRFFEKDHGNKANRSIDEIKADFVNLSLKRKRELV